MANWRRILNNFDFDGTPVEISPIGNGHINDTFRLRTLEKDKPDYVVQKINSSVFRDVDAVQQNIDRITSHIRTKLRSRGEIDVDRKSLHFVVSRSGKSFCCEEGEYWRMYRFIDNAGSGDGVNERSAYLAGRSFGDYQSMLSDLPGGPLKETIPGFHDIELRIEQFRQAIAENKAGRLDEVKELSDALLAREEEMTLASRLAGEGKISKRVTHCDTKVDNVLFDKQDGKVLCVIDLDTTMPGYVLSDFGDFVRTACNSAAEDEPDTDKIDVRMDIFKAFARGYIESSGGFITSVERELLPFGALMLTYMQTIRFLTDYLNGDTYYKIAYPEHNLVRTRAQFRMLERIDAHLDEMKDFIASL